MHSGHIAILQNLAMQALGMKEKGKPTLCEFPPQPRSQEGTLDTSSDLQTTLRGGYCYIPLMARETDAIRSIIYNNIYMGFYKVKQFVHHCIVISDTPGFESYRSHVKAHAPSIKS